MKRYIPFAIIALGFLILKLSSLGIRLSDTNIYFYTGHMLLQGKVLYKDVFFTNLPLFPYVSSMYALLTGGSLTAYYFTAAVEAVITGFFIYLICLKEYKKTLIATFCTALYLFSFLLLSTTDHQTGVFLASLFSVISYYFYLNKKLLFTGICIALAILTKAYFLPILATYGIVMLWGIWEGRGSREEGNKKSQRFSRNDIVLFTVGFASTTFLVLLPSLLFAKQDFIRDVFEYSLTRSQGIPKGRILWFFVTHDLLLIASFLYSLLMIRTYRFFGVLAVFSLLFYFLYKDVYYLYLNFLLPFFALAFANLYVEIEKRITLQQMVIPTIIGFFLLANLFIYSVGYRDLQRVYSLDLLISAIKSTNPPYLYGGNGITPALAYLTGVPLVNPSVDMNSNLFRKGFLDAKTLTAEALHKRAMFVGEGIDYPEYTAYQPITDEVMDIPQLEKKKCALVAAVPIKTESYQNRINLIFCNE